MVKINRSIVRRYAEQKSNPLTEEEEQACRDLEATIKMIKEGGSTGDPIEDFDLFHFLNDYLADRHPVRELMEGIEPGELVLIERNEERNMLHMEFRDPYSHSQKYRVVQSNLRIGILEDKPKLSVAKAEITLPMSRYVMKLAAWDAKWEMQQGPIELTVMDLGYLNHAVDDINRGQIPGLRAFGGKQAIDYFRGVETRALFRDRTLDTDLVHPLRMLSYPVPEDFQQQYDGEMYAGQVKAVEKLQDLLSRQRQVETREKPVGHDQEYHERKKRTDLRDIGNEIAHVLQSAEKYEMRTTVNDYKEVPGQTIRIGEFANALWNKYVKETQ